MVVPIDNMDEAKLVYGIEIIGLENSSEVVRLIEGKLLNSCRIHMDISNMDKENDIVLDFADVKGKNDMIEAVMLAEIPLVSMHLISFINVFPNIIHY